MSSTPALVDTSKVGPRSLTSISTMRSSSLPARRLLTEFLARTVHRFGRLRRGRHQQIQQPLLGIALGALAHFLQTLLADHVDRDIHQVADHRLHIAADVSHFGELAGFYFQKRRICELGKTPRDFSFADARGADHEDVLGHHLLGHFRFQLLSPDPIAQRDRDCFFSVRLPDDILVELADNFARG